MTTKKITFDQMLRDEMSLLSDVETLASELRTNTDPARFTPLLVELKEAVADLETLRQETINLLASTNPLFLAYIMNLSHED